MKKFLCCLLFACSFLLSITPAKAQSTYNAARTDINLQAYPSPFPTLPAQGSCITSSEYFSTANICRVTGAGLYGAANSGSAEVNLFSSDDTRFLFSNENSGCWNAASLVPNSDPASFAILYSGVCLQGDSSGALNFAVAMQFSFTQPKIAYGLGYNSSGNIEILQYNFTSTTTTPTIGNGNITVLKDLTQCDAAFIGLGPLASTALEEIGVSTDDQTFGLQLSTNGGQDTTGDTHVIIWNRTNGCRLLNTGTGAVTGAWGTTGTMIGWTNFFMHNGRLNQDGTAFKITPSASSAFGGSSPPIIWTIAGLSSYQGPGSSGHTLIGVSHFAYFVFQASINAWHVVTNSGSSSTTWPSTFPTGNGTIDAHGSWNNDNSGDTNPQIWSTFNFALAPTVARENEIVGVNSSVAYRFGHTYTSGMAANGFDAEEAIGAVSADGKYFIWASDWNNTVGSGQSALFIMHLPLDSASGGNVYISQSGTGTQSGLDSSNTKPLTYFNTSANWNASPSGIQIGPGVVVHAVGIFTAASGTNDFFLFQLGGSSGKPITLFFETGAVLQAPYFGHAGGAIDTQGLSFIIIDGSSNGIIQNTANGTSLANHQATEFIQAQGGSHVEIKNLTMANGYIHTKGTNDSIDDTQLNCVNYFGSFILIHDNVMHDNGWCLFENFVNGNGNNKIYNNNSYNITHNWMLASQVQGGSSGPWYFYNNHLHAWDIWDDPNDDFHHDGIHCFTSGTNGNAAHITALNIYDNLFDGDVGVDITAPIFLEGGSGSGATPCDDSTSVNNIFNNVFISPTNPSNNGMMGDFSGIDNVYNNTMVCNSTTAGVCYTSNSVVSAQAFKNNIVSTANQLINVGANLTWQSGNPDYNLYANGDAGNAFVAYGTFYGFSNFSSWQSAVGGAGDAHSHTAASANLNAVTGVPNSGSPALKAGVNLTSLCVGDLVPLCLGAPSAFGPGSISNGSPRPTSGAWDIGAIQSGSLGPPPTPIVIGTNSLPSGTVGNSYSAVITASGGTPPYSFTGSGFAPGLNLTTTGQINGTPTTAGNYSEVVMVTDSSSPVQSANQTYSVTISAVQPPPTCILTLSPSSTQTVQAGNTIQFTTTESNCTGNPVYTVTGDGSINVAGLFTAGSTAGSAVVSSTIGTTVANTSVTITAPPPPPTCSVTVSPSLPQMVQINGTLQFSATTMNCAGVTYNSVGDGIINSSGLFTAGSVAGTATITASVGATVSNSVSISVVAPAPPPVYNFTYSPTSLSFTYQVGGTNPASKTIAVGDTAPDGVHNAFTVSASESWLAATSDNPQTAATVTVVVNPTGLIAGAYTGHITLTSSTLANSPVLIPVTLTVTSSAAITVSISPTSASLITNHNQQFIATVLNTSNTSVTWSTTIGTISSAGLLTTPATAGSGVVTATSVADITKSASANIVVNLPTPVLGTTISCVQGTPSTSQVCTITTSAAVKLAVRSTVTSSSGRTASSTVTINNP